MSDLKTMASDVQNIAKDLDDVHVSVKTENGTVSMRDLEPGEYYCVVLDSGVMVCKKIQATAD